MLYKNIDVDELRLKLQEYYHTSGLDDYNRNDKPGFEKCLEVLCNFLGLDEEYFTDFITGAIHQWHIDYFLQRKPDDVHRSPRSELVTFIITDEDKILFPEFRFYKEISFNVYRTEVVDETFDDSFEQINS